MTESGGLAAAVLQRALDRRDTLRTSSVTRLWSWRPTLSPARTASCALRMRARMNARPAVSLPSSALVYAWRTKPPKPTAAACVVVEIAGDTKMSAATSSGCLEGSE